MLEVGMGGRLDATNVVEPLISIVTDISLDHMEWLGPTIAAIAREKAGILHAGGTMITLPQHPEANQVLGEVATELGCARSERGAVHAGERSEGAVHGGGAGSDGQSGFAAERARTSRGMWRWPLRPRWSWRRGMDLL